MFYGTTVENLKTTSQKMITDTKITQFAQFAQCFKRKSTQSKKQIRALFTAVCEAKQNNDNSTNKAIANC